MIISELCEFGNLNQFFKKNKGNFVNQVEECSINGYKINYEKTSPSGIASAAR